MALSNGRSTCWAGVCLLPFLLFGSASAQFLQQGPKLVGYNAMGGVDQWSQGQSVALSADGNTAFIGSTYAGWIFRRNNCGWIQQTELTGQAGGNLSASSVALSADGATAVAGGQASPGGPGAVVFTFANGLWTQQGSLPLGFQQYEGGMALSGDGNTIVLGLQAVATGSTPQILVFVRSQGVWSSQGSAFGPSDYVYVPFARQPIDTHIFNAVALSTDGNTLLFGVPDDNGWTGATFVFTRSNGQWTEQAKLTGADAVGAAEQGNAVALSNDGNTALIGGPSDNEVAGDGGTGAAWVFTRSNGIWTQQGNKLAARDAAPGASTFDGVSASQGWSVSLSGDGNTAIIGGPDNNNYFGAAWIFARTVPCPNCNGTWSQQGHRLLMGGVGLFGDISRGLAVSISGDGNTALVGTNDYGPLGQIDVGSTFVFAHGPSVFASAGNPQSTASGAAFASSLEVTAVDSNGEYLPGATISFSGPASGPGLQQVPGPVVTDATGRASIGSLANGTAGSFALQSSSSIAGACSAGGAPVPSGGGPAFSLSNMNAASASGSCVVTSGVDDNGSGTLRSQVAACGKGGAITFDPSVSLVNLSQGQDIQLLQDVTIDGGASGVTIDAHDLSRIFFVFGGNIVLRNLTLRNGSALGGAGGDGGMGGGAGAGMGGAVFVNGGSLSAGNVTFFGNDAFGGDGGFGSGSIPQGGGGGGTGGNGGFGGQFGGITQNGNGGGGGDFGSSGGTAGDGSGGSQNSANSSGGFGGGVAPPSSGSGVVSAGGFGGGGAGFNTPGAFGGAGSGNDGGGGAGLGGAIFIRSGNLLLAGSSFSSNSADGGINGGGLADGQGKGGALFIGSNATAAQFGSTLRGDSATDSGGGTLCKTVLAPSAADTDEVCGVLLSIAALNATSGGGQTTAILTPFPAALVATVTDAGGNPIGGVPVTFSGPASGASIGPNNVVAITDIHGNATATIVANSIAGSYTVTASFAGMPSSATYSLTNRLPTADLSVTKSGPAAASGGDSIPYTLTVTNGGPDAAPNVTLTDAIPGNTGFESVAQSSGPAFACTSPPSGGTGSLNCTVASLPGGATASFSVVLRAYYSALGAITNTASVSAASTDPATANNTSSVTTTLSAPPPFVLSLGPLYTLGASYRIAAPPTPLALGPIYTAGASYRIAAPPTPLAAGPIYTVGASYRIAAPPTPLAVGPIYTAGASYRIAAPPTPLALGPIYTAGASYRIAAPPVPLSLGPIYTQGASYRIAAPPTLLAMGPIYTAGASYRIAIPPASLALGPIYTQGASYRIAASPTPLALGPIYTQGASYLISRATLLSSAQVSTTASGLVYSRVSQTFNGTITVRNISSSTISGPIQIVFTALPNGVTLANPSGTFNLHPYLTVSNVTSLAAGQSAVSNVAFHNPTNVTITFTPVIYSGSF